MPKQYDMALYDDDDEDDDVAPVFKPPPAKARKVEEEKKIEAEPRPPNPVQLKFLQQQIQRQKVAATSTTKVIVPPVIDLTAKSRPSIAPTINLKPPKPVKAIPLGDAPPLSFIPHSIVEDKVLLFGEYEVIDEYQPAMPTDYSAYKKKREEQKAREEAAREVAARLEREHHDEAKKRTLGAAIAPPQALLEEPPPHVKEDKEMMPPPTFQAPPGFPGNSRGLGVAASIMSKMGYKAGAGLGKTEQGMSTALVVEKVGQTGGKIISENRAEIVPSGSSTATSMVPPAQPVATSMTEALKTSTKILLLKNMVGPLDVDEDLEPEIRDEMKKYGQVVSVVITKKEDPPCEEEAVGIYVEFTNAAQAIKAYVDLNGRYFGGRSIRASFYDLDSFHSGIFDQ